MELYGKDEVLDTSESIERGSLESWTDEEERQIRRKLDRNIVPMLTVMYLVCFIDRTNIGNAKIQGMADDLNLKGYKFNFVLTAFYLSYTVVEIPSNIILKRIGARVWLPALTVAFGVVCIGTAFTKTYVQLIILRILLGFTEGGMLPGSSFYLSNFYRREELLFRIGVFATSASLAGAFGGLLATALVKIPEWGVAGAKLHAWRNIFFFEGLLTLVVGLISPIFLPKDLQSCKFFTERERKIAIERISREQRGAHEKTTMADVKRALFNINTQFCAFGFLCANVAVQSISLFMPTILNQMKYSPISSQLHSVPPYFLACVLAITIAFISDRTRQRGIYLALFAFIAVIGYAVIISVKDLKAKYAAVFIIAIGAFPNGPGFLCWGINNTGSPAVRAVASGYIMSIGTLGAVVATWTYMDKDKPNFIKGHAINLGFQAVLIFLALGCTAYCYWENKQRAAGRRDHRLQGLNDEEKEKLGYRHPSYKYMT